ncbi:MAG: pyrroline-5-carboxylate reductase [Paracoccaceae bacterium]
MSFDAIKQNAMLLLGCGKMGTAMLEGWLNGGISAGNVWVLDPFPAPRLQALSTEGLHLNAGLPAAPAICIIALKPQMIPEALPQIAPLGTGKTVFLSVAAGTSIATFEAALGGNTPIIRAMPNTPAAIGRGITALFGNAHVEAAQMQMAEALLQAVGQTVQLETEDQMDAVTAVSGSGPAYVFHLIETLAAAGVAEGLTPELAMTLAKATVAGAGALAEQADEGPAQLRINVTSPGGTTAAALEVLMDAEQGFPDLLCRAVHKAAKRSKELGA